jgi:hypothetical protein
MAPQSWSVLIVAAAFLLLGIACSPLAWVALLHRRSRLQELTERRLRELAAQLLALETRINGSDGETPARHHELARSLDLTLGRRPGRLHSGASQRASREDHRGAGASDSPTLIAVPELGPPPSQREALVSGLTQRYAAIWSLADSGAPLDAIARAAGQPIGEIELILGLRRKIEGTRTAIPHAPHV